VQVADGGEDVAEDAELGQDADATAVPAATFLPVPSTAA